MENFIQRYHELKLSMTMKFCGPGDLSTSWDVKSIVDNEQFFFDVVEQLNSINSIDEYVQYLLLLKLSQFDIMIPLLIHEEYRDILSRIVSEAKKLVEKLEKREYVHFISGNIELILMRDDLPYETDSVTLDLITELPGIDISVISAICNSKRKFYLLEHFDKFKKRFEENPELLDKFFIKGSFREVLQYDYNKVFDIWGGIYCQKKSNLRAKIERLIDSFEDEMVKELNNVNDETIYGVHILCNQYYLFLKRIEHRYANVIRDFLPKLDRLLNSKITEQGECYRQELKIADFLEKWQKFSPWECKLLSLTHVLTLVDDKPVNAVSSLDIKSEKLQLVDLCSSNIPTDEDFPFSIQNELSMISGVSAYLLWGIFNKKSDYKEEFKSLIIKAIELLDEKYNLKPEGFLEDLHYLFGMLDMVSDSELPDKYRRNFYYGVSMFICALTDKLLRLVRLKLFKDQQKYVRLENSTIEKALKNDDSMLKNIFSEIHLKNLSYFFLKVGKEHNIGKNYRNALAHWADISPNEINERLVYTLLWLFVDVVNSIYVYDASETI